MTFSFNNAIPATNNDPSADQPDMLTNNISTDQIIAVDHISFNTAGGGQHKQVTFNNKNAAGAQTDPQSTLYTASGTASTKADMRFRNENGIFPASALRAFAYADNSGAVLGSQSFNVATITRVSAGKFTVALTANAVTGSNFLVFVSVQIGNASIGVGGVYNGYTITGAGTFQLNFLNISFAYADPATFTFQVIQV